MQVSTENSPTFDHAGISGFQSAEQGQSHTCCESPCSTCGSETASQTDMQAGKSSFGADMTAGHILQGDRAVFSHAPENQQTRKSAAGINISAGPEQGAGYGPDARPLPETDHRDRHSRENQEHGLEDKPQKDSPGTQEEVQSSPRGDIDHHSEDYKQGEEEYSLRGETELSAEERQELQELRQRDAEVRAHEQAHIAAGGQYVTGGASYSYETGPDGRQYAVEGEVSIDSSPVPGDAEKTEEKARTVRRAALAPANPSPQDQRIAADAARMEAEARMEQRQEEQEEQQDESGPGQPEAGNSPTSPPPTAMKAAIQAYQSMINSF